MTEDVDGFLHSVIHEEHFDGVAGACIPDMWQDKEQEAAQEPHHMSKPGATQDTSHGGQE